ncbi:hypothetical protein GIB67_009994 [Kingdonia uniflora]|uniref:Exocyst subunit Exo70 family protein n=1 Tax=Kingdonia uniflora TaxID=39325 RepID=A0A7J7P1K9_9MAGN|nr:hypothetical protein GIB67_009994 [Kingdonia uniflora]
MMEFNDDDMKITKLELASSNLKALLQNSEIMGIYLQNMDKRLNLLQQTVTTTSKTVAPLQSLAMATKALDTRINRAVSPALILLDKFKLAEFLQSKLLNISDKFTAKTSHEKRLKRLIKALYEMEVDAMRYEGLLDDALLSLQDEYESILQQLTHRNIEVDAQKKENETEGEPAEIPHLGSELEIEVLRRISEALERNDCLDICIDIFVKVRYRRAAKALMRLNPEYLRTYAPEEIDEMEWENLELAITHWIQHFELAVRTIFVSEKRLCNQVLTKIMDGEIWVECFVKIADKIMAVFFRFGEGVARSSKEPQKLFKLLDMLDSLEQLKNEFSEIFEGDAGVDICLRLRELEKLLIHASSKVFWEFGLEIEGNQDGFPPPQDGSVPKLVRYAVNYLKYLAADKYSLSMANILRTEQIWKSGYLSKPETDENLLKDAISNVMEALERNIELKKSRYKDKVLPYIFSMNTYWYIYMRTRQTELGKLLGDQWLRKKYKTTAEESAYMYVKQAWGTIVRLLDTEDLKNNEAMGALVRVKMEAFMKALNDNLQRHRSSYNIPDADLRDQIREATLKSVVPTYASFLNLYSSYLPVSSYFPQNSVQDMLAQVFGNAQVVSEKLPNRRRDSRDLSGGRNSGSVEGSYDNKAPLRRSNNRNM